MKKFKIMLYKGIPIYILIFASIFSLTYFVNLAPLDNDDDDVVVTYDPDVFATWTFDELEGQTIDEATGRLDTATVSYLFNNAVYKESHDPSWREHGIDGGSLLFDGFTTHFSYEEYALPEDSFTISVWVAPRAFGVGYEGKLNSFMSNYRESYDDNTGRYEFISGLDFGMFRHGSWAFKAMFTNDEGEESYVELWDEGQTLEKYQWNYLTVSYNHESGRIAMYRNGVLASETTVEHDNMFLKSDVQDLFIGKNANSYYVAGNDTNAYMGLMDELIIYNSPKSDDDILTSYNTYLFENDSVHPSLDMEAVMWHDTLFETDRYRPQYHATPVQSWMNEPHAPVYFDGQYHFFYQFNPFGPYFGQHHWGHWVSDDMIHWEHEIPAIAPFYTENNFSGDGIWSGGATLDKDGRPVLFYTAGPSQTIGMAMARDLSDPHLRYWDMYPDSILHSNTLPAGWNPADFRDPHIWQNADKTEWYMLITAGYHDDGMGKQRGASALYSSTDLRNWTFRGPMLEPDSYDHEPRFGSSWELTVLLPLKNEDGEHVKDIYMFLPHGGGSRVEVFYFIGNFNEETYRFEPDHRVARKLDYGDGIFTGASGFVDPNTGKSIMFTIAQSDRDAGAHFASGWAHNAGMPIELWMSNDGQLQFGPIEEIDNARGELLYELDETIYMGLDEIDALNDELSSIQSDLLNIEFTISSETADDVHFKIRKSETGENETLVGYDFVHEEAYTNILNASNLPRGTLSTPISNAPVELNEDGTVTFRIFLDRSLVETYINEEMGITKRIYPDLADALGIEISADGYFTLHDLVIYEMTNVYGETEEPYYGN